MFTFPVCHWSSRPPDTFSILQSNVAGNSGDDCGATVSLSVPGGVQENQLVFLSIANNIGNLHNFSGFTTLSPKNSTQQTFYKIGGPSEPASYDYTYLGAAPKGDAEASIIFTVGLPFSTPIDTYSNTANSNVSPSITTSYNNEMLISIGSSLAFGDFLTPPSGWTLITRAAYGDVNVAAAYKYQPTAGASGTATWSSGSYFTASVFTIGVRSE